MSFRLLETVQIPENERVVTDRPDYTVEESTVYIDRTVQTSRLESVIIARSEAAILAAGYNSDWVSSGEFVFVRGGIFSDESGTIYIDQSDDGETLIIQTTQAYTGGGYAGGFVEEIVMPYLRIRFVPDDATTTFHVWTRLSMEG